MEMPEANEYISDPEYMECVSDILDHPVFQSMDQYIQHGTTTCKCHCIQVSYLAYTWCKRFGGNWRSAARAGLLHDLFLYDWHTHARETGDHFHGFTHPRTAMVLKTLIDFALNKSFNAERLVGSGGMPSSHSATVCGLTTAAGLKYGAGSFEFAISFILSMVVMYDAVGVRQETGKQARLLNSILLENPLKLSG